MPSFLDDEVWNLNVFIYSYTSSYNECMHTYVPME